MSDKENDREEILKQLHGEDDDSSSGEDDLAADLQKLKQKAEATDKPQGIEDKKVEEIEQEAQRRSKETLMNDLYAQMSDDEDDEEEKTAQEGSHSDNPFKAQLLREAQEL